MKKYAGTNWCADDILSLEAGKNLTKEQAEEFLEDQGKHILEAMISAGWEAIDTLLTIKGYS